MGDAPPPPRSAAGPRPGGHERPPGPSWGDLLVALGVLGLGSYFVVGAFNIRVLASYSRIGPRFFPFLVAAGLLLCGVLLLVGALRGARSEPEGGEDVDPDAREDWRAVLAIGAALLVDILLIERLGFVLASTLMFWGVALGFGSRRYGRDALAGVVLSVAVYLVFTRLLDLNLPAGVLPLAALLRG